MKSDRAGIVFTQDNIYIEQRWILKRQQERKTLVINEDYTISEHVMEPYSTN